MNQNLCSFSEGKVVKMKLLFNVLAWILFLLDHVASGVGSDEVSVSAIDGDSVTLHTGVETNQQEDIKWYFSSTRIAQISGDLRFICTDVQCNTGTERFRDRLKLDHQTGSLTITNTRTTDSGVYHLQISSRNNSNNANIEEIFSVTVQSYFSASTDGVSVFVMERDSVTFQTGVETNQQGRIRWYFNDVRIAQITGDLGFICTDVQCNEGTERFRDRLKLDNQTGSLIITSTRTTDSGDYKLQIISSRFSISRKFTVSVTVTDPGPPSSAAGINAAIILSAVGGVLLVAFVIYCCHKRCTKQNDSEGKNKHDEENGTAENLQNEQIYLEINVVIGSTTDQVVANKIS